MKSCKKSNRTLYHRRMVGIIYSSNRYRVNHQHYANHWCYWWYPDGSYGMDNPVTRAEVVTLLNRYLGVEGKDASS